MNTLKTIGDDVYNQPLEWYKYQYIKIHEEQQEKLAKASQRSMEYYRKNRERILQQKKEKTKAAAIAKNGVPNSHGRPRKYKYKTHAEAASSSKD